MPPVIDAHTHAWGPPTPAHPWTNESIMGLVSEFDVDPVYSADDLVADMDRLRIDEAVVVGYPIVDWTDNWYTLRAAAEYERLSGIVMLDHFGEDAVEIAAGTLAQPGIIGLRIAPGQPYERMWRGGSGVEDPDWLSDAIERESFWTAVRETGSIVTLAGVGGQLDRITELIERYPDLTYLFDGYGSLSAASTEAERDRFAQFAAFEDVGVKASHTPFVSEENFPYHDVHELLAWLIDVFGVDRVVWGSDFPNVTSRDVSYAEAFNWLHHVEELSRTERRQIEGDSLAEMIHSARS